MATLHDAARIAAGLPEVVEGETRGLRSWAVNGKTFAWERAYSKADLKRFGEQSPPAEPILAVKVADLGEKEAVLAAGHAGFFTIAHFDGYPAVLIELKAVARPRLREAIVDGWLACAPAALAQEYTKRRRGRPQAQA